ncbi:tetratricopeptide repeat protein, partial [Fulvivirga sp.]
MAVVQTEQAGANREVHLVDSILTNFYALYSANFDNAIRLMEVAQQLSLKNGWQEKEANALMYFGIAHSLRGNYEKALKSYFSASEIFQKISDFNGIARLYNEISVIYRHQGHMQRAYAALDKAEAAALA